MEEKTVREVGDLGWICTRACYTGFRLVLEQFRFFRLAGIIRIDWGSE